MYHPRLKGNHYDMGFHYGELLAKAGVSFEDTIKLSDEQTEFGTESLRICEKTVPKLCEEIKGLADGLKFPYERFACWLLTMYGFGDARGCTCFCFNSGGKVFFARNSDMFPGLKPTSESILYRPDGGNIFLANSTSMVQMEDGVNEHGLAVGMNFLANKYRKPGLNTGMAVRYILETCETVREAVDLLKEMPLSSAQNIMLADKSGDMRVVECSSLKMAVRTSDSFLVSANHFMDGAMQTEHANPSDNWYGSKDRYATAENALSDAGQSKDGAFAQNLLSGKMGFMCQYEKKLNFDTIWSVVYGLHDLSVFRTEGNPAKTKFKEDTRLSWGMNKK